MIALALGFLRSRLGIGKSEIGVILHLFLAGLYLAPVLPQLDFDMMMNIQYVIGAFTFSSIVGRIESSKSTLKALHDIFLRWGKK